MTNIWQTFSWTVGSSSVSSSPLASSKAGDVRVREDDVTKSGVELWRDKHFFLSFGVSSYKARSSARNSLFSCYCSLLVPASVPKHLDASFNESRPPSPTPVNFKTVVVLYLGSGPSWSASSRPRCFRILTRLSRMRSWSWELSQSKTFSTPYTRICVLVFIHWVWGQSRGMTAIRFNSAVNHPGFGSPVFRYDWD